jgi:hypothetical protein
MNTDPWDLEQYALAAENVAAKASRIALAHTRDLVSGAPSRVGLLKMYRLTALARRIENRLTAGQAALDRGDVDSACLEWSGALELTDKLATIENQARLVERRHHQKSGSAG